MNKRGLSTVAILAIMLGSCSISAQTFPNGSLLRETPPGISVFNGQKETPVASAAGAWNVTPSWTPDGAIIFISDRSGTRQIWRRQTNGALVQIGVLAATTQAERPQQGRNGTIIFAATIPTTVPNSNQTIYVMDTPGSVPRVLTLGMQPAIAPSGTWLVFTRQVDNPYRRQLFRINTDGSGEQQLTFETDPDYPDSNAASISPDETKIAFFSGVEQDMVNPQNQSLFTYGHRNVATIPATGGARQRLTDCKPVTTQAEFQATTSCLVADNPDWLNGSTLIFDIMFKDRNETWKVNTSGTSFVKYYSKLRGVVPVSVRGAK